MKMKLNKKGDVNYYLVGIIITILTFFIYISFFLITTENIVSESNDLMCRGILSMKSNSAVKTGTFFLGDITQKCKKDEIKKSVNTKDEAFKVVGDSMRRCWFRYGEGQYDFMNAWEKEGNWCFTCANINLESSNLDSLSYNDYIDWTENNLIEFKNGTKVTYYDYVNMKYAYIDDLTQAYELKDNIEEILREGDAATKDFAFILSEQYNYMQDLRLKEIKTNDNIYVVYRYDKPDNSLSEKINGALWGAAGTTLTSMVVIQYAETILWGVGTTAVCGGTFLGTVASGGLLAPSNVLCAMMGARTVESAVAKTYEGAESIAKISRLSKIANRIKGIIRFSQEEKVVGKLDTFVGDIDEIAKLSEEVSKIDPEIASKLVSISEKMKKMGVTNIDDISVEILKIEGKAQELENAYVVAVDIKNSPDLVKYLKNQEEYSSLLKELEILSSDIKEAERLLLELKDSSQIVEKTAEITSKKKSLISKVVYLSAAASGAYAGSNLNFHNNQYVDIMTKEQYYRLCGTEPEEFVD